MTSPTPIRFAQDRTLVVPAGCLVKTGYVPLPVAFACHDRMSPGDVELAYRRRLQLGDAQPWPPPVGAWHGDVFRVHDGRHESLAAQMLGFEHLLVAWIE